MVYNQYLLYFFCSLFVSIKLEVEKINKFDKEFEVQLKYLILFEFYIIVWFWIFFLKKIKLLLKTGKEKSLTFHLKNFYFNYNK